jgi:hypothetical protein
VIVFALPADHDAPVMTVEFTGAPLALRDKGKIEVV